MGRVKAPLRVSDENNMKNTGCTQQAVGCCLTHRAVCFFTQMTVLSANTVTSKLQRCCTSRSDRGCLQRDRYACQAVQWTDSMRHSRQHSTPLCHTHASGPGRSMPCQASCRRLPPSPQNTHQHTDIRCQLQTQCASVHACVHCRHMTCVWQCAAATGGHTESSLAKACPKVLRSVAQAGVTVWSPSAAGMLGR